MLDEHFFAPCPRGLEVVLVDELTALRARQIQVREGGVAFCGGLSLMRAVNLWSRVASRVLWRVGGGAYRSEHDVYRAAREIDWSLFFDVTQTFKVKVDAKKSPLTSLKFVGLKIKDAICDGFRERCGGVRPSVETVTPDMRVHAFLDARTVVFYLDTSGEALFKRGWRVNTREAPIRENLAAGLLHLAGWTPDKTVFDPMCGSGTFLIEAAEMALNRAAGLRRSFAFERLKGFDADLWQREREAARAAEKNTVAAALVGFDADRYAVAAARENAVAAGVEAWVQFDVAEIPEANVPDVPPGILVTNPPYGVRLDELEHLDAFYPELGRWLKQRLAGWTAFILTADPQLAKGVRLSASRRTPIFDGALECRFLEYRMVAGSHRKA